MPDWRVEVYDATTSSSDGALLAVATTDAVGAFSVHALPAQVRRIRVVPVAQPGWLALTTSFAPVGPQTIPPTLYLGVTNRSVVSGAVYLDTNHDGAYQVRTPTHNDTPLTGWTVFADLDDDGMADADEPSSVTGVSGFYPSLRLAPRAQPYVLRVVPQPGYAAFSPASGAIVLDLSTPRRASGNFGFADTGVVARHVFYNNSAFDGNDPAAGAADDAAVATDKRPLFDGEAAGARNLTGYSRGINGVMIDVLGGLPATALAGIAQSIGLKAGAGGDPATWADAPRPSQIAVRPGAGVGGSDRITLVWPDGAIRKTWLRVSVPAVPEYGLAREDVFYFGNLVGETGDAASALRVAALDMAAVRRSISPAPVPVTSAADINRDGRVNALDLAAVRSGLFNSLRPIATPGGILQTAFPPSQRADDSRLLNSL
jgi:hypothetical protein